VASIAMRRRILTVGLLATLAVAGTAAVSLADVEQGSEGGVHYRTDVSTDDPATIDVRCGPGTHATGGGFGGGMAGAAASVLVPLDGGDRDRRPDDGWRARLAGGETETVAAYLTCTGGNAAYAHSAVLRLPAGGAAKGTAKCPPGTHVIGGGALAAPRVEIDSSYPIDGDDSGQRPDDGWRVRVESGAGALTKFHVEAVCQHPQPAYATASEELAPGIGSAVFTPCPPSRHLLSAGAELSGPADTGLMRDGLHPWDGGDADDVPDDEAYAFGTNELAASAPKTLTGYAICR
jgi:hypothetical protein